MQVITSTHPVTILALVDDEVLAVPPGIRTTGEADTWLDGVRAGAGTVMYCRAACTGMTDGKRLRFRPTATLAFRDGRLA